MCLIPSKQFQICLALSSQMNFYTFSRKSTNIMSLSFLKENPQAMEVSDSFFESKMCLIYSFYVIFIRIRSDHNKESIEITSSSLSSFDISLVRSRQALVKFDLTASSLTKFLSGRTNKHGGLGEKKGGCFIVGEVRVCEENILFFRHRAYRLNTFQMAFLVCKRKEILKRYRGDVKIRF